MRYSTEVIINAPRQKVVELFDNPENMKKWMHGLQSFEPISGQPGQPGARSKLVFQSGRRRTEMTETIISRNLPHEFAGRYEAGKLSYSVNARFADLGNNKTQYINDNQFNLTGLMKIIGWLMPGAFRKESQKHMEAFKAFVEGERQ
jgi:carbon monoxide dehydrogenase subunit G